MDDANQQKKIFLYDTTLRDGCQRKGLSLSLQDKLKIAKLLDEFGISYIEGGWPGSNPKDKEFFQALLRHPLKRAKLVAFGSTRRAGVKTGADANLEALLQAQTQVVALVGKSWSLHVEAVLHTSRQENLEMVAESIRFLKEHGKEVVFDAEHFFDGFFADRNYALETIWAARQAGADWIVLCDTNGRFLPEQVFQACQAARTELGDCLGVHTHNDSELAVANALSAIRAGARQVQGTVNGYGERCGNANLISLIANLQLKLKYDCIPSDSLGELTRLSRQVSEIANVNPDPCAPYVGVQAFAHKAGLHVAAVEKIASSYEHVDPASVGNSRQVIVSELSGRGNIRMLARQLGLDAPVAEQAVLAQVKALEGKGYQFESAEGTVELLLRRSCPDYLPPFKKLGMSVVVSENKLSGSLSEAVVKLLVGEQVFHTAAAGIGPVAALDKALRKALLPSYPQLQAVRLSDYKVRILDPDSATDATTRVIIEATSGEERWSTVGCSKNIIEASYEAIADSLELFLSKNKAFASSTGQVLNREQSEHSTNWQEVVA